MALAIKKVLISDSVDASAVKILESHGVQVTLKTDYTKPELLQAIQVNKIQILALWQRPRRKWRSGARGGALWFC